MDSKDVRLIVFNEFSQSLIVKDTLKLVGSYTYLLALLRAAQLLSITAPEEEREEIIEVWKMALEELLIRYNEDSVEKAN